MAVLVRGGHADFNVARGRVQTKNLLGLMIPVDGRGEKAVGPSGIAKDSHDLAAGVDSNGLGETRARDVDRGEGATCIQEAMIRPPGGEVSHDLASVVNPAVLREFGAWHIDP